jgi:hypothetical protein
MWEYQKAEWKLIDDFLTEADDDVARAYSKCGFSSEPDIFYGDDETFAVAVRRRVSTGSVSKVTQNPNILSDPKKGTIALNPGYKFVVSIWIGGTSHDVAVKDLPDLMSLLGEVVPLAQQAKSPD